MKKTPAEGYLRKGTEGGGNEKFIPVYSQSVCLLREAIVDTHILYWELWL